MSVASPKNSPHGRVRLRLEEIASERMPLYNGRTNVQALSRASGIDQKTIWYLLRHPEDRVMISLNTIAALCEALDCQPGDLLVYERSSVAPRARLSDRFKADPNYDPYTKAAW